MLTCSSPLHGDGARHGDAMGRVPRPDDDDGDGGAMAQAPASQLLQSAPMTVRSMQGWGHHRSAGKHKRLSTV